MSLFQPVREYINSLVHSSARGNPLACARHRNFIAPRILGGFAALGVLPLYLVLRGTLNVLEAAVFAWFALGIAIAYFLSRSGRYESAHAASSLGLTVLVTLLASASGGLASPAVVWLVLLPLESALTASRRVVFATTGLAFASATLLGVQGIVGWIPVGYETPAASVLSVVSLGAATIYAALLALGMESLTRTGSHLLNAEEARYRLLALNMTDGITRHGRGGITLFASPAAGKLLGVAPEGLLGHGLFDRVHVADRPAYLTALSAAGMDGADRSVEFRVRRSAAHGASGERDSFIWIEMRCRSFTLPAVDDPVCDVVAVMRDVTDRKAQEEAVTAAHREAESAHAAKSQFLATMSHELRTPLNAVIGFSDMLMNEDTLKLNSERRRDYARLIHDSGQHLLSVVNLVLDMSKIETGNFVITTEPFLPGPVVSNCCDLMALKARNAGLDIIVRAPADLPEVSADKRALKQMLFNLLSNAIKFTQPGGQIIVSAAIEAGRLAISVEDTGVGISEADLPRVGDPFFQAQGAYNRSREGTGLGLSIVKGLVDLHGGRMNVQSRVGVGTRVSVEIPMTHPAPREEGAIVVELPAGVRRGDVAATEPAHWNEGEKRRA